jgi:molecular chaperone HtpG
MTASTSEQHEFKAGIAQLLDILVHSVYTSKEIFLRELISNSTDALEKLRFLEVQGDPIHDADAKQEIVIEVAKGDGGTKLIVADTGIGMTADEVRENIGTIAHSGATKFIEALKEGDKGDVSLIGRFGIGFYAVFMVADHVTLTTRSAQPDSKGVVWESDGKGSYTITELDDELPRGTRIEITLREDEARFAELSTVKDVIRRHSNFVPFPLFVESERVNTTQALWREQPSQVSDEDYNSFYTFLTYDSQEPRARVHVATDSPIQFSALLFVPDSNPEAMGFGQGEVSLQLYVKRVLIDADNKDLLPNFLRFMKGVVESEDLPLNISRETLQENRFVVKIRELLTKKIVDRLKKMAKDEPDAYAEFWTQFGRFMKEGYSDFSHRDKLPELYRFSSAHTDADAHPIGLADYVSNMKEGQQAVYFLSGASREALDRDPRLEMFRKKNVDVIYLIDMADEFVLNEMREFDEKPLRSADQVKAAELSGVADVEKEDDETDDAVEAPKGPNVSKADLEMLVDVVNDTLGDRVRGVQLSERLVDSPACLVNEEGMSSHVDKVMRIMNKDSQLPQRTLELNPDHALVKSLAAMATADRDDPFVKTAAEQLFEGAMLADGFLADPHTLVERMHGILTDAATRRAPKDDE